MIALDNVLYIRFHLGTGKKQSFDLNAPLSNVFSMDNHIRYIQCSFHAVNSAHRNMQRLSSAGFRGTHVSLLFVFAFHGVLIPISLELQRRFVPDMWNSSQFSISFFRFSSSLWNPSSRRRRASLPVLRFAVGMVAGVHWSSFHVVILKFLSQQSQICVKSCRWCFRNMQIEWMFL